MEVFLSELAESKLLELSDYLIENWNKKTRDKFIQKLTEKIDLIALHHESCPESSDFKGLFKCVVTKQTTFYYRVHFKVNEIEIITLFDSRQDPKKLKKTFDKYESPTPSIIAYASSLRSCQQVRLISLIIITTFKLIN
jgi:plasmid stabilization system protein ParE